GDLEDLDQSHRIVPEPVAARGADLAADDLVALELAWTAPEAGEQSARSAALLRHLLVDVGEEHAGQVADGLRLQEVVLHEALDGALAGALGEIHSLRHLALDVERQPVFRALGDRVQVAADGQQETLGAPEAAIFLLGEQPDVDELGSVADAVDVLPDPVQRLQVAKAALAVLDVGLDDVAAVAHALVARIALGELLGNELGFRSAHDIVPETLAGLLVEVLVAPQVPPFEDRGADRQVALRHPHHFVERAARMTHFQAKVPQEVEQRLDHLLTPRRGLGRRDERD